MSNSRTIFDQQHYDALNDARRRAVQEILTDLIPALGLRTAIDLGCGPGHFTEQLHKLGLDVLGVDGREQNVEEAKRRYPHLKFEVADAQELNTRAIGSFDLVFCFGLIYHLENPFRVIRSVAEICSQVAMVEGMVYPSHEPVLVLIDEPHLDDQGLNYLAYYPSEASLVKMLLSAGLVHCYLPKEPPAHDNYRRSAAGFPQRSLMIASRSEIKSGALTQWSSPTPKFRPWNMYPLVLKKGIYRRVREAGRRILRGDAGISEVE